MIQKSQTVNVEEVSVFNSFLYVTAQKSDNWLMKSTYKIVIISLPVVPRPRDCCFPAAVSGRRTRTVGLAKEGPRSAGPGAGAVCPCSALGSVPCAQPLFRDTD